MKKGDRCKINKYGKENVGGSYSKNRIEGVIVGESRDKLCWRIKWDGLATVEGWHKDFIAKAT
jgi:hypothetical protein